MYVLNILFIVIICEVNIIGWSLWRMGGMRNESENEAASFEIWEFVQFVSFGRWEIYSQGWNAQLSVQSLIGWVIDSSNVDALHIWYASIENNHSNIFPPEWRVNLKITSAWWRHITNIVWFTAKARNTIKNGTMFGKQMSFKNIDAFKMMAWWVFHVRLI